VHDVVEPRVHALTGTLLQAVGICKSFAGVRALDHVSFDLLRGEVHGLVGENGAGKSTLIKIMTGAVTTDSGTLSVNGRAIERMSPALSRQLGIAAIYQQPSQFRHLSVAENIAVAHEAGSGWRPIDWRRRGEFARKLLQDLGARIDPDRRVDTLSMPERQLLEIAKALGADAKVLIMDEPTASLTEPEVRTLFNTIAALRRNGVGIIYISHRLEEIAVVADRVTILRDGRTVATIERGDVARTDLVSLMVGRELSQVFPKREVPLGDTAFEVRSLASRAAGVHDISFSVRAGEIFGIGGLVGSGRTELATTLFGLTPADSGQIFVRGESARISSPRAAIELGVAYVPEDRRRHGVVPEMSVAANVSLPDLRAVSNGYLIDAQREQRLAERYVSRLKVKTPSVAAPVDSLSGGNQQKIALARWLATKPAVLVLDEPTQGVDVGAKAEIHELMEQLAAEGLAIIMISSELPELLGMSDRIAVMRNGMIAGTLPRGEATEQRVLGLALGVTC
jgi:rhamnose transport system ATP-binding protein